jgi:hypothetical protein
MRQKKWENEAERLKAYRLRKRVKPDGATDAEWEFALDRARRAVKYDAIFPHLIKPSEIVFQDSLWQWVNEALTPERRKELKPKPVRIDPELRTDSVNGLPVRDENGLIIYRYRCWKCSKYWGASLLTLNKCPYCKHQDCNDLFEAEPAVSE